MSIDLHLDLYRIRKKHFRISAIQDTISKERKYAARKPTGKKKKKESATCILWLQHLSKGCSLAILVMVGGMKNWFAQIVSFFLC